MGRKPTDCTARRDLRVHERIATARASKGLSVTYMAEKLGVHRTTYERIESGGIGLSLERLDLIARLLRVSVGELFGEA